MGESPTWCPIPGDYHPCIMLVNNCKTIEPQKKLLKTMKRRYSDQGLALMVYIGDGLYLHHKSLSSTPFQINGIKSSVTTYGHLFKGVSPSAALLWLKRNGSVQVFHHILIASGNLAGRSISYGCKDEGAVGLPFWHLTHHRLVLPPNSSCPAVIQRCRLCTTFESNVPLKLYVNKKDEQAIIKSYWSQEEIVERSKSIPNEQYLNKIMAQLEMLGGKNGKIPTGRRLTINSKLKVCKPVKRDDGGLSMSSYVFDGLIDRERESIAEKIEQDVVERKEIEQKERDISNESKTEFRVVDESKIKSGTILEQIFRATGDAYESLNREYSSGWVPRARVVDWILERQDRYSGAVNRCQVQGHLRAIFQDKTNACRSEDVKGMIWIKEGEGDTDRLLLKIN